MWVSLRNPVNITHKSLPVSEKDELMEEKKKKKSRGVTTVDEIPVLIRCSLMWCWRPFQDLGLPFSFLSTGIELPLSPRAQAFLSAGREISRGRRKGPGKLLPLFFRGRESEGLKRGQSVTWIKFPSPGRKYQKCGRTVPHRHGL